MAKNPIVFALANPTPEISYTLAKQTRSDVIMATGTQHGVSLILVLFTFIINVFDPSCCLRLGRSDFPNQVNNVCAFPYIFRGALDCRATKINEQIKKAATTAIAMLAREDKELYETIFYLFIY
jgi:malate dehydrogenase (oxaloacetate-decarboxylating)(NADP+)